jgi:hypothetical protein
MFHHRVSLRCFDEYVNSVCEGQNSAAKTTNTGTKAIHGIDTAVNALDMRAVLKDKWLKSEAEKRKQSVPLYSNTEASRKITQYAELNAHDQCKGFTDGTDKYWMWKKDAKSMWVLRKKHATSTSPGTTVNDT